MPIGKTPEFSRTVAQRALKEHGLEGKVTPEQLADAALVHDTKNQGYVSKDEFALAARTLKAALGGDAAAGTPPAAQGPTFSPLSIRLPATAEASRADLGDPRVAFAKERILANTGADGRFGELDAGEGLHAFTLDKSQLQGVVPSDKLAAVDGQALFAVLTTGARPELSFAASDGAKATILAALDLGRNGHVLAGDGDGLMRAAALLEKAPVIDIGTQKTWDTSSWKSGAAFASRKGAADAQRKGREDAAAAALAGPTSVEAFRQAGVVGHKHTDAEKKALLKLVEENAGPKGDKTFPNPDDSYYGLHVFLLEGPAAAHAVAFAQANRAGPLEGSAKLNLDDHSVLVTIKSFDEAQIGTFVVERESGKVLLADESNGPDLDGGALNAFFPSANADEDAYDAQAIGALAKAGERLAVVEGESTADDMDFSDWS